MQTANSTPKSQQPPEGLASQHLFGADSWIAYLADKNFPVRASSLKKLQVLLRRQSTTINDLCALIKTDPVMCLHVTRAAEVRHAEKGSRVTSIDHAVSSMGMDSLEDMARKLKPVKLNPASVQQKHYLRSIADSHHAAFQARAWLQDKRSPFADEIYLAALFYAIGYWAMWLNAPLHMHQIQSKIWDEQIDSTLAEFDVLGCSIQHISMGLAQAWGLSELTIQAQDPATSPSKDRLQRLHQKALNASILSENDIRSINHLVQEKFFPVKLANWLAQSVSHGWRTTRNIQVTDILSDYLATEPDRTLSLLHQLCAQAARNYHAPGTLSPAAEMLFIPSDLRGNYKLGTKELALLEKSYPPITPPSVAETATEADPKTAATEPANTEQNKPNNQSEPPKDADKVNTPFNESFKDAEIYKQSAQRLLKGHLSLTKPAAVLQELLRGVVQGMGFPRVALSLINNKTHRMRAAQVIGFDKSDPIAHYEIDLQIPSLFKKLANKPNCVWIQASNKDKFLSIIPENYQAILPQGDCLLMSIFKNSTPIAIVYVDAGSDPVQMTEFHQERFKYLCSAATLALKRLD